MHDKISDLIIRLKNAGNAGRASTVVLYSKVNLAILELLVKKGYIESYRTEGSETKKTIEVKLSPESEKKPRIKDVKRISKPSKREYRSKDEIFRVRQGYGMLALSTSKGVMSGDDARKAKVGGEALFEIW